MVLKAVDSVDGGLDLLRGEVVVVDLLQIPLDPLEPSHAPAPAMAYGRIAHRGGTIKGARKLETVYLGGPSFARPVCCSAWFGLITC